MALQSRLGGLRGVPSAGVELQQGRRGAKLTVVGHRGPGGPRCGCGVRDGDAVEPHLVEATDLAGVLQPEVTELEGFRDETLEHGGRAGELEAVDKPHGFVEHCRVRLGRDAREDLQEARRQPALGHVPLNLKEVRQEAWLHHEKHPEALQQHVHRVLQGKQGEVGRRHHQALLAITDAVDLKLEVLLCLLQGGTVRPQGEGHERCDLCELALGVRQSLGAPCRKEGGMVAALSHVLLLQILLQYVSHLLWLLHARLLLAPLADEPADVLLAGQDHLDLPDGRAAGRPGGRGGSDGAAVTAGGQLLAQQQNLQLVLCLGEFLPQALQRRIPVHWRIRLCGDLRGGLMAEEGVAQAPGGRRKGACGGA
mmetsp:Transcript_48418/g.144614  ORF Transcript_48418/g.144614 Transcript_48418/m.144614 type:complete len:367 (-) Transcript_48418:128-1228(-)